MQNIIAHTSFDTFWEVAPNLYSVAMLLLLLRSKIVGFGILQVHPVSVV
jgi:hypothetical protein